MASVFFHSADEQIRYENFVIEQFMKMGFGYVGAIDAMQSGVDYHDVEAFLKHNPACSPEMAVAIVK